MARRYKRSPFKLKLKKETIAAVSALMLLGISGLIFLSFFNQGSVLGRLQGLLVRLFGWGRFIFPFVLIFGAFALTKIKTKYAKGNLLVGSLLILLSGISLFQSGLVGESLWSSISGLVSDIGAYLLFFIVLVIGFVVFFNTSLDTLILTISKGLLGFRDFVKNHLFRGYLERKQKPIFATQQKQAPIFNTPKPKIELDEVTKMGQKKVGEPKQDFEGLVASNLPVEDSPWVYPPLSLLSNDPGAKADRGDIKTNAGTIEKTLESFGIAARVGEINGGPAVTQYALEIALGTKLSKITALQNDLALALATKTGTLRIEAPIPGKSMVGIEVPNISPELVTLRQMLSSAEMQKSKSKMTIPLGLDVAGNCVVADIGKMPHVLIAGQTGSGKSVAINSFIASILFRATPKEVKLILIDPKRVELTGYTGIPHLLTPVIVEVDKVLSALKWAIKEMEDRYKKFATAGQRNIEGYNEYVGFQDLPYIVIIIDELADIMAYAPSEVEDAVCRLAQMARATGIHLVLSTQRPSVDVITGLIKANITSRIAFTVSSMIDSRVILDTPGAEKLLGRGDMLYIPPDQAKPTRIQGTFVSSAEIQKLVDFLKGSGISPEYTEEVITTSVGERDFGMAGESDEFFIDAIRVVCQFDRASASLLQRRLRVGYARAARLLDQLEAAGVVGPAENSKPRDVLLKNAEEFIAQMGAEKQG